MQRTLISDDGERQVWEVADVEGNVVGTDVVCLVTPPDLVPDVTDLAAALATLPPDTLAALRAALGLA